MTFVTVAYDEKSQYLADVDSVKKTKSIYAVGCLYNSWLDLYKTSPYLLTAFWQLQKWQQVGAEVKRQQH